MTHSLSVALGLLRELAPHVVKEVIPVDPAVQAYMQSHGLTEPPGGACDRTNIRPDGREAFQKLSECIIRHSTAMERGVKFASVQTELLGYVGAYAGRDQGTVALSDAEQLRNHFVTWFDKGSTPRRVFVPCALSRWQSNDFVVGPVSFFFIGEQGFHTFYTPGTQPDAIAQKSFIDLLKLMKETRTERMARVEVEGCDHERAQDVGELAVDLAIVAFQLAEPYLGTRNMCRLDSRRGAAEKRVVTEANGYYNASWTLVEPGLSIGTGTLGDMLKRKAGLFTAVGNTIRGFTTAHFRLPVLETAWCDAAYWLHQALAESIDNIAIAKLETAVEVLLQAESGPGSKARILAILDCFFGLQPGDPIRPGSKLTAKQFAKNKVRDRSRILHGTWSTLNLRPGMDREGMEGFTITVLRSAVLELDAYCQQGAPADNVDAFLDWMKARRAGTPGTAAS